MRTEWPNWAWTVGVEAETSEGISVEAIVVFVDEEQLKDVHTSLVSPRLDSALRDVYRRGKFCCEVGATFIQATLGEIPEQYVVFVACEAPPVDVKALRLAAAGAGRALAELGVAQAAIGSKGMLHHILADRRTSAAAAAIAEGLALGAYARQTWRREHSSKDNIPAPDGTNSVSKNSSLTSGGLPPLAHVRLLLPAGTKEDTCDSWLEALLVGQSAARAVCYARDLTNLPGNMLTPSQMAVQASELAERFDIECRIYDEKEAEAEGMGGLLAVGKGSVHAPRMIVLRYTGNPASKKTLGLVGKGITFDTGGVSLKKPEGMEEMISDMGGAATVLGVMHAIGQLKPSVNVVAVIAAAENVMSGSAYKPGDIITTYSGRTVEVLNTDAEGRIVLADGLTTALRWGATSLIDVATLTGAVMVGLGDITTGAFTNEESFLSGLIAASGRAGEYVWPLPTHAEYRTQLKSSVADLKNHGGTQYGAAIFAALFVGTFAEERPWIHLDIGGTAWRWSDETITRSGGTGVMVLSLIEYIRSL